MNLAVGTGSRGVEETGSGEIKVVPKKVDDTRECGLNFEQL